MYSYILTILGGGSLKNDQNGSSPPSPSGATCKKHSAWPDNGAWNCVPRPPENERMSTRKRDHFLEISRFNPGFFGKKC